jgi:hypothetical protein
MTFPLIYFVASFWKIFGKKNLEEWHAGDCILHHDITPGHSVLPVKGFLVRNYITVTPTIQHFPYLDM